MQRIIIFANGELPYLEKARLLLQRDDYIICADGGTRHALALGLTPHLVIGDMDSINKGEWQDFEKSGVSVELFPQDKNETDLELAIHRALELDAEEVIIIGALGGRLDQTLGNIALLATPPGNSRNIRIDDGVEEIFFCRNQAQVHGRNGDIVSLIPWGNPVHGIQTEGLKWTLHSESLYPEKTRGISNEMIREVANIKISSGVLLIVHTRRLSIRNRKS
jgi:thiamine pyrophosphokinase